MWNTGHKSLRNLPSRHTDLSASVEIWHEDLRQIYTCITAAHFWFFSQISELFGSQGPTVWPHSVCNSHSSWELNNRNTSLFLLGQRLRGSCTCVWSQIPLCLFSQSGIGVCAFFFARRDCESVKQYFPFFLFSFFFIPLLDILFLRTRSQQKTLCVCVSDTL